MTAAVEDLEVKVATVLRREEEATLADSRTLAAELRIVEAELVRVLRRAVTIADLRRGKGKTLGAETRAGLRDIRRQLLELEPVVAELGGGNGE